MHVLIIGAAGMIGRKLTASLLNDPTLGGGGVTRLSLADVVEPIAPAGTAFATEAMAVDLAAPETAQRMAGLGADVILHLAAIVSGEAELDFDKGYKVNLDGTRLLLEAIRARVEAGAAPPRFVFASSIAVFGPPFPDVIGDDFLCAPATSYGAQKAMAEMLVTDFSRRGFIDGLSIRLPTICIRPGLPNKAASGFFSGILREPLAGREAVLPVSPDVRHWHASPRSAVGFFRHAAGLDLGPLGTRRALNMPGISATVAEQIEALRRFAGEAATALIRREPDPMIERIVAGWPRNFDPRRARELGFTAESSFDEIIRVHVDDELTPDKG
jgi:D-erythronate 2-dehydrogenase